MLLYVIMIVKALFFIPESSLLPSTHQDIFNFLRFTSLCLNSGL